MSLSPIVWKYRETLAHLKIDGWNILPETNSKFAPENGGSWKMIVSFWDGGTWQVRTVSFRECTSLVFQNPPVIPCE